ncbi:unnamed protein product, partial [Sphacelaria rigidula]
PELRAESTLPSRQQGTTVSRTMIDGGKCSSVDGVGGSDVCAPPAGEKVVSTDNKVNCQSRIRPASNCATPETEYFTDGAAARGKTNWGAGVCGRGDIVSYEGEGGCTRTES